AALICMGVLWATGTAKTLLVADPGTIGASVWGALLLAKAALVAGATAIAATMRARLRRGAPGAPGVPGVPGKGWLTADFAAAAAIAAIAAAMALSSPY
ncbi:CopD family protein, partial [Paenibacillus sp.]|uniref:CopD family protein n=1 Tax=Paenibacillus sp. TaxID=58172 RepID=UPI002D23DF41